jgi:hypothetical protein
MQDTLTNVWLDSGAGADRLPFLPGDAERIEPGKSSVAAILRFAP